MARKGGLSNETIYRQKWAMFVDNTIARRASSGGTEGVGERVELRDLMHLEEVLSKIEACSRESLGDVGASQEVRKPLEAISCLHPLFKNPSASFLDSLYPTLPPTGNVGAQPKSSHQVSGNAHHRAGLATMPGRSSGCSTAAARASPALIPAKEGGKENSPTESAGASPARGIASRARLAADANDKGGGRAHGSDATSGVTFGKPETMRGDDRLAVLSEEGGRSVWPVESRTPPISPGCLRRLESLNLEPGTRTPAKQEPSSQQPRVVHAGAPSAQEVEPLCGTRSPLSEQPCEAVRTVLAQTQSPPHDHDTASCRSDLVDDMCSPLFVNVLSLSARLDVTHIEGGEDSRVDDGAASLWSEEHEDPLGVTVLDAGRCGGDGDRAGAGAMVDPILGEIDGSEKSPRGPNSGVCLDDASDGLNSPEYTSRRLSCGPMPRVSVKSEESLSDAGRPGEQTCIDNILDESGPPEAQLEQNLDARLLDESMAAAASVYAEVFGGGLASPLQPTSEVGDHYAGDDESTLDGIVESPELTRRASAGSRNPGLDRGTWRGESDARGGLRQSAESNVAESFLGCSPIGSAEEEPFGSAPSPTIGGFGFMNGEAPSPLAHADSFLPTDGDATGNFGGVGLSPPRSTRSDSRVDSGAETPARRDTSAINDSEASGEVTLTPDASSRCLFSPPRKGEPAECESGGPMPPPSRRQPLATLRRDGERRQRKSAPCYESPGESGKRRAAPTRVEHLRNSRNSDISRSSGGGGGFQSGGRHTASSPAMLHRRTDGTREELISYSPASRGGSGGYAYNAEPSIGSFSDSNASCSRFGHEDEEGQRAERQEADVSLVEGTPRRRGVGSGEGLAGFYAPLAVTKITIDGRAPEHASLSTVQWSTLQWMSWREGGTTAEDEGEERPAGWGGIVGDEVRGGVLGHLSVEEASACLLALIRNDSPSATGGRADRAGLLREETGLPQGATLLIAPTKDMVEQWSDRLGAGAGLSVLSYTMPLKERRRLSAKQAAAFDVVVTTYDILKAKEVPRTTSDRAANSGEWLARNSQERRARAASRTESMVSLLHGVRWNRVVADGAHILANPRSARAVAVAGLVGGARWCVVERKSMVTVENASDRMRSLTAFLGIPAEVPLVEAAECLFYHSRPSHIAQLPPRGSAADMSSIIAGDSPCSQRSTGGRSARTPLVDGNPGKLDEPLAGQSNGSKCGAELRERGGRGRATGRVCVSSTDATQKSSGRGVEGGGKGVGFGLSRSDVTYAATMLRFRRPQASDLAGRGRCRDER